MTGPHPPSRASSFASLKSSSTTESQNAALLGATTAFGRPQPKKRAPSNTYSGANGALAAATTVGTGSKTPSPTHRAKRSPGPAIVPTQNTEGSNNGESMARYREPGKVQSLGSPRQSQIEDSKSPSRHAAQLAAARSPNTRPRAGTTQKPLVAPKPRRLSEHHSSEVISGGDGPTDTSPIPPTTSLVDLFERKSSQSNEAGKRPGPIVIKPSRDLAMKSPKPLRMSQGGSITSMFQIELERDPTTPKPNLTQGDAALENVPPMDRQSSSDEYVSASEDTTTTSSPITIRKRNSRNPSISSHESSSVPLAESRRGRPSPSPLRHTSTQPISIERLAKSTVPQLRAMSTSSQSAQSVAAQFHQLYPRRMTPLNSGDALANAIVASSLASSRAPSPRKLEPPPLPPGRRNKLGFSRTPSPAKHGMRHTLRKAEETESETDDELHPYSKHHKKRLVRKHPNKHHEGDRKRWRDAVTERERKRYEGVWAANKGLHCSFTPDEEQVFRRAPNAASTQEMQAAAADQVSNIVTRDVWSRSRLPDAVLETVWDLVDNDCVGRLNKEEFVVGMWLIDQRLKGRKLPVKVSESVWTSVRTFGIKIRRMH